ncbi:MAG: globin [Planctomycetaceae bacterium]
MTTVEDHHIYDHIGRDQLADVVAAFYRQVPKDPLLRQMYPADDMEGAESRLRSFLLYRFGGPQEYLQQRGHPRLRGRHAPFSVNSAARDRWIQLMDAAIVECQIPDDVATAMRQFFSKTATFLINSADD